MTDFVAAPTSLPDLLVLQTQRVSTQRKTDTRHQKYKKNSTYPTILRGFKTWTIGDNDDVKLIAHSKRGVLVLCELRMDDLNLLRSQLEHDGALGSISDPLVGRRSEGLNLIASLPGMSIPGASEF